MHSISKSKLRCKTLGGFRYYKDTFLTRVFTRDDCQQPFWKETFLAGLPKSLGDKVREKIRTQFNGEIPYNQLSYGQLIAYIQKVGLKICQDEKIQNQLAREKAQNRKDLGSFCQQFGLPFPMADSDCVDLRILRDCNVPWRFNIIC